MLNVYKNKYLNRKVKVIANREKLDGYDVSPLIKENGRYNVIGLYDCGNGKKGIKLSVNSDCNCVKFEDVELLPLVITMYDVAEKFGIEDVNDIIISTD